MSLLKTLCRQYGRQALIGFFALVLVFQFAGFVSVFSQHIDSRALLSARDADGAHIIGTANRTRWYKDNGESAYGAFYYRAVHTLAFFAGRTFINPGTEIENSERAHHLAAMTLSLVAVFAMAFLVMSQITDRWESRLLGMVALVGVLLNNPTWATFVYRAHPDMLFAFFVLLSFILSLRSYRRPDDEEAFRLAALSWGVSGMCKLTWIIFLPGLVLLWWPPLTGWRKAGRFYLWMVPSYIFLGFPQSLNFPRSIRFLSHQASFNMPPTMASFGAWMTELQAQLLWPLALVAGLALLGDAYARPRGLWRFAIMILAPLAVIARQNSDTEALYYLIPIVAMTLVWVIWLLPRLPLSANARLGGVALLAGVVFGTVGFVPATMDRQLGKTLSCRDEAQKIYDRLHLEMEAGRIFVLDPYLPFDATRAGDRARSSWSNDWAFVTLNQARGLGINRDYAREFADGSPARVRQKDSPNWQEMVPFYRALLGPSPVTDPAGGVWDQVVSVPRCGFDIWLKK